MVNSTVLTSIPASPGTFLWLKLPIRCFSIGNSTSTAPTGNGPEYSGNDLDHSVPNLLWVEAYEIFCACGLDPGGCGSVVLLMPDRGMFNDDDDGFVDFDEATSDVNRPSRDYLIIPDQPFNRSR